MTQAPIKDTAQRFANRVVNERVNTGVEDAQALMRSVMDDRYPGISEEEIFLTLVSNTVDEALTKTTRDIANRLINTGTLDMFGHPGFECFETIDGKPWGAGTLRAHADKLEAARETARLNAEEHRRLWEEWTQKEARYTQAFERIMEVIRLAEDAGLNPEEVTIEQAKAQGFTGYPSASRVPGQAPKL